MSVAHNCEEFFVSSHVVVVVCVVMPTVWLLSSHSMCRRSVFLLAYME